MEHVCKYVRVDISSILYRNFVRNVQVSARHAYRNIDVCLV